MQRLRQVVTPGKTLDQIAAELGLTVAESQEFGAGGAIPGIGFNPELTQAAMALPTGQVGGPVADSQGAIVFQVTERKAWDPIQFASVREETRASVQNQKLGQLLNALVGGTVDIAFDTMTTGIGHVRQGNLVGLGVSSKARNDAAQDMPAVSEFVPGFDVVAWNAIIAPAKTPQPIIDRLYEVTAAALKSPQMREKLEAEGAEPVGQPPAEFRAYVQSEIDKWGKVIKAANVKFD